MAEISVAPASASLEARAVRSGGAAGGATELGKFKLGEWFRNAKSEITSKIGLKKAETQIEGNKSASEKIKNLGTKIVNGVNGIGNLSERASSQAEAKAYKRSSKASEYERKLAELRNKPLEAQRLAAELELAKATLRMHELSDSFITPNKKNIIERGKEATGRLVDAAKERFYGWRAAEDNRKAESDLTWAVKYGEAASVIHDFANNFETVIEGNDKAGKLKGSVEVAKETATDTTVAKEKSAEQFNRVITEGATVGKAGITEINQQEPSDVKKQQEILRNLQAAVTKTGTQ